MVGKNDVKQNDIRITTEMVTQQTNKQTKKIRNIMPVCEKSVKPEEIKKLKQNEKINTWKNKVMDGQYLRDMDGKDKINTWKWLQKSDFKGCTEALIFSAQEHALRRIF